MNWRRTLLIAAAFLFVVNGIAPSGASYSPSPGHVLVINQLTPGPDGACAGALSIEYAVLPIDREGGAGVTIGEQCTVDVYWQNMSTSAPLIYATESVIIESTFSSRGGYPQTEHPAGTWRYTTLFGHTLTGCWNAWESVNETDNERSYVTGEGSSQTEGCGAYAYIEWATPYGGPNLAYLGQGNDARGSSWRCYLTYQGGYDYWSEGDSDWCVVTKVGSTVNGEPPWRIFDDLTPGQSADVLVRS